MGDSGLTAHLGIAAMAVIVLALVMAVVAWRIPKRPVRVGIGLGLLVLGSLGVVLSFVTLVLVTGLGVVVLVLGISTRRAAPQDGDLRPVNRQAIVLGALTAWPFAFCALVLLAGIFGLIPKGSATPPPPFVVFFALLVLTPLAVLGLLVFYLVYLFTKTPLPPERKLIWAAALVAGHVLVMPVFWWRHVWKPRSMAPLPEAKQFAWLIFGPLLLAAVLPMGYLVPMAIGITGATLLGNGPGSVSTTVVRQSWAWVFGLGLTFVVIAVAGRWCHAVSERLRSRGAVWSWLWFAFTLMLLPVAWFGTVFLRSLIPSDGPPRTLRELTRLALIVPLLAQPGVILWLYLVARWRQRGAAGRSTSKGEV